MSGRVDIEVFVAELKPVQVVSAKLGLFLTALGSLLACAVVALLWDVRPDIRAGNPAPIVLLRGGALILLGLATSLAVVGSAKPAVGQKFAGWQWALAAAALFPLSALFLTGWGGGIPEGALAPALGKACLGISGLSAFVIGAVMTIWLKRGAPTNINRAGWLVGLTAGSFGTFAYSLHCPMLNVFYVGLWYTLAVAISALVGRLVVPIMIRW